MLTARKGTAAGPKGAEGMAQYLTTSALTEPAAKQAHYLAAGAPEVKTSADLYAPLVLNSAMSREEAEWWLATEKRQELSTTNSRPDPSNLEQSLGWLLAHGRASLDDVESAWWDAMRARLLQPEFSPEDIDREVERALRRIEDAAEGFIARTYEIEEKAEVHARESLSGAIDAIKRGSEPLSAAEPRRDMHRDMAHMLRIDTSRNLSERELASLMAGKRADGGEIEGVHDKKITYIDFTLSSDKSASIVFALGNDEERAAVLRAHRIAAAEAMAFVESEVGWAIRERNGERWGERGYMAWARIDHHTSRPTLDLVNAEGATERIALKVAPDMNLHSHVVAFNHVLTDNGHLGSIDAARLHGFIHVGGRYYQAVMAREISAAGIDTSVDEKTGAARITDIPDHVRDHFSKRTRKAEGIARNLAEEEGRDWDSLSDAEKIELVKKHAAAGRQHKELTNFTEVDEWRMQAKALSWNYKPVTRPDIPKTKTLTREQRAEVAYEAALPFLEKELAQSAVVDFADLRLAATTGLVATKGVESPDEINSVINLMRERGVRQNGEMTRLVGGLDERFTTEAHVGTETELVALASAAAADKTRALSPHAIEAAIRRSGLDLTTKQGEQQRKMIHALGGQGRLAVGLGVAGSGKTTALKPLVDAWRREERELYGASLAWRQADDLKDAGIDRVFALSVLLRATVDPDPEKRLKLDRNSVVVVDELGLVGTADMAWLLRVQERTGCKVVAIGDSLQCQSPEAGDVVTLLRRAMGDDAIPKVAVTTRQETERERTIAALFRKGKPEAARAALAMKAEDGTLEVTPGGYDACVRRVADLWAERDKAAPGKVTVSAPTNEDARAISVAIREKRRSVGKVGPDVKVVKATDANGVAEYDLPLARGDRVRLFKSTTASFGDGKHGSIGRNGSVVEIVDIGRNAVRLRNAAGKIGVVKWSSLADEETGRIKLAHGDCLTVHSAQGLTSQEHIAAAPAGTRSLDASRVYVAQSRHRTHSWLVTSDGAERAEIKERRALGDERPITESDVMKNMARNLSRREAKSSALELWEKVEAARREIKPAPAVASGGVAAREAVRLHRLKPVIARAMRRFSTKEEKMSDTDKKIPIKVAEDLQAQYAERRRAHSERDGAWWRAFHKDGELKEAKEGPKPKQRQAPRP